MILKLLLIAGVVGFFYYLYMLIKQGKGLDVITAGIIIALIAIFSSFTLWVKRNELT